MLKTIAEAPAVQTTIIILNPEPGEARQIAGWLRRAGLSSIFTARTADEALFLIGRQNVSLLICDEAITQSVEARLLWHIQACGHTPPPAIVRIIHPDAITNLAPDRPKATEIITKPISSHDVVLRVGSALQRPDLLGVLDRNTDQSATHLATARRMQLGLLPTLEQLSILQDQNTLGISGFCRSGDAVGGDFWGVWPTSRGRLAITLADFAGHGLSAALNTFRLHTILSESPLPRGLPRHMTSLLNQRLHALLPRGDYATMIYLLADPVQSRVAWCSAGGPPPLYISAGGAQNLDGRGLPLGIKPDAPYQSHTAKFAEPGILCLFSDGLYEGGAGQPDISRAAIAAKLTDAAALAKESRLVEAAELATAELESLGDEHPTDHVDDVMAVCLALGGNAP